MAKNGRIAVDRSILNWRWYKNANTFRVFMHLLLTANYAPADYENIRLERGDVIVTYSGLGEVLGLSVKEVRTALDHLKETGETAVKKYPKYQVVSIVNYDSYQWVSAVKSAGKGQSKGSQTAVKGQLSNKKNNNNINNNIYISPYNPPLQGDDENAEKKAYGEYGNVLLTEDEFGKLAVAFPGTYLDGIKDLDMTMEESERNRRRYADTKHYIVIQRKLGKASKENVTDDGRLSFDLEDILEIV